MKTKFQLNSITFIALISAYFSFALSIKFWQFAFEKIEINSLVVAVFAFSLPFFVFIPLFWFFSLITLPRITKPIITILLICSAISDYALQNLGVVINSDMIRNFFETNAREASDLITFHAVFYVLIVGILPCLFIWKTKIIFAPFRVELRNRLFCFLLGVLSIAVISSVSYKEYASFGRNNKEVRYYINTFNYIYAIGRYYKKSYDAKRQFIILDSSPQIVSNNNEKPRLTVLIVGETARAKNFSLYGYEQETNPFLSKNDEIIVFKDVSSCGTATAVSLPCLFSHLTRKKFDVTDALYTQNLLDIAQMAGYDILWYDNDDGCKKVCDRVFKVDAKDNNKSPFCFGNYCHDEILLEGLEEKIDSIKRDTLIVLHTMGSHGPTYFKRYPDKFKHFTPACETANLQDCTQEQIINTYNNTIVYTDYIIAQVVNLLKRNKNLQTSMLYVSDHGESLGENNIYLHGLPYAIAPNEQKKVPMILWLSKDVEKSLNVNMPKLKQIAANNNFSHDNYFHTVLRLLGIKTTAYNKELDVFN